MISYFRVWGSLASGEIANSHCWVDDCSFELPFQRSRPRPDAGRCLAFRRAVQLRRAQRHAVEPRRNHIACSISRCKSPARNVHNPAVPHSAYSGRSTQQVDSMNLSAVSRDLLCCVHHRNDLTELTSCRQPTLVLIILILNPLLYCLGNFIKKHKESYLKNVLNWLTPYPSAYVTTCQHVLTI